MTAGRPTPQGHATARSDENWAFTYTPRLMPRVGIAIGVVIVAIHLTFGILLTISDTGPDVGPSDQAGLVLIGVLEAAVVIGLLTRARLRVGPHGVGVRNVLSERFFTWDQVAELMYPEGKFCARLILPFDEYAPVLAVQARDRDRAVTAMERFRELQSQYGGEQS